MVTVRHVPQPIGPGEMGYTCFISYNTRPEERVVVYRLQTLASASGITVLLPLREGHGLTAETKRRIRDADSVIAFLTSNVTAAVREELAYAQAQNKLIVPIADHGAKVSHLGDAHWIKYDPRTDTPGTVEKQGLEFLEGKKQSKDNQQAALLAVLAIGLLALLTSEKS